MARTLLLDRAVGAGGDAAQPRRHPGRRPVRHGRFRIDELAARGNVALIEQPAGNGHEVRVAKVMVSVRESELLRFRNEMQSARAGGGRSAAQVKRLDELQRLPNGQSARRRRSHAADTASPVGETQRLTLLHAVGGKVLKRQVAPVIRRLLNSIDHGLGDGALIERIRPSVGDGAERCGKLRVPQHLASRESAAGLVEKILACGRGKAVRAIPPQQQVESRRDGKTLFGERDSRRKHLRPGQPSVLLVHRLEKPKSSRHADAGTAENRFPHLYGPAAGEKAVRLRRRRRDLASVIALQKLAARVPVQGERAPAEPRRLRLDKVEHELNGDRGIHGAAAGAKQSETRLNRIRVGRYNHKRAGSSRGYRPRSPVRCGFWMRRFCGTGALARRRAGEAASREHSQNQKVKPQRGDRAGVRTAHG